MAEVEVYSGFLCGYCFAAKPLLRRKGVAFEDRNISLRPGLRMEMMNRAGGRHSVPQIFIDGRHIGDCYELLALNAAGTLDTLLGIGS